jgi:hypothetical protein
MTDERNPRGDQQRDKNCLPEEVLNNAADPNSFQDPLEVQLEKSRHMNSEEETHKLEDVKKKNRGEGDT